MIIRTSEISDLSQIVNLLNQAKSYFERSGIDQWQNGYPNGDNILQDIVEGKSFVFFDHNQVLGTMYFTIGKEPNYEVIEDGQWLTDSDTYAVMHRIVVDERIKGKGVAKQMLDYVESVAKQSHIGSLRIDTHKDNLSMQRFLQKNGFQPCGIIYVEDGTQRIGFEKILNKKNS